MKEKFSIVAISLGHSEESGNANGNGNTHEID
jgi:hypothetical protein